MIQLTSALCLNRPAFLVISDARNNISNGFFRIPSKRKKHSFKREAGTVTGDVLINDIVTHPASDGSKQKKMHPPSSTLAGGSSLLEGASLLTAVAVRPTGPRKLCTWGAIVRWIYRNYILQIIGR
jgi:hypothetical protein